MEKLFAVFVGLLFLAFISFLLSWPVYMLWNGCLVGTVAGVSETTWLNAWGLNMLFGFWFKAGASSK